MNSKGLQYNNPVRASIEIPAFSDSGLFRKLMKKIIASFNLTRIEEAQASYKMKHRRQAHAETCQDIVNTLPIEEKLRLGMYRYMG